MWLHCSGSTPPTKTTILPPPSPDWGERSRTVQSWASVESFKNPTFSQKFPRRLSRGGQESHPPRRRRRRRGMKILWISVLCYFSPPLDSSLFLKKKKKRCDHSHSEEGQTGLTVQEGENSQTAHWESLPWETWADFIMKTQRIEENGRLNPLPPQWSNHTTHSESRCRNIFFVFFVSTKTKTKNTVSQGCQQAREIFHFESHHWAD